MKKYIIPIALLLISIPILSAYLPVGLDWRDAYRPAALAMLRGDSPYESGPAGFFNAPWALLPFLPAAIMPYNIGRALVFIMGLCGFAYIGYRLGARPVSLAIFLSSASVIGCLNNGNIDWLPLLAILMPARYGLIFASIKPQIGIGLGVYWLWESWKEGGIRMIVKNFAPVSFLFILSFAVYGFWLDRLIGMQNNENNMSLFPYGVILGLAFLLKSFMDRNNKLALASSPMLAPYVSQFSWSALLIGFIDKPLILLVISIALWIPVLARFL